MFFRPIALLSACLFATSLAAQEPEKSGTITGNLGETSGEWSTLYWEGLGSSANYSSFMKGFTAYTLQGHVGNTASSEGAVLITFTRVDDGTITEPDVIYLPTGSLSEFMQSEEGAVEITFDDFTQGDTQTELAGSVTGIIRPVKREGMNYVDDPEGAVEVNLIFSTTAYPE